MTEPERRPGISVRMQLTLSYAALIVIVVLTVAGVGLLILRFIPDGNLMMVGGGFAPSRDDLIGVLVPYSLWALLGVTVVGLGGGWLLAGRMLKPLTRITDAAALARDGSLSHRIRLPGRENELTALADTFDEMLARMERAVAEQRRFAANASHELRTPNAVVRTMLEVARADPAGRDVDALLERIGLMNERSVVITEALLALADADHHDRPLEPVRLDDVVAEAIGEFEDVAAQSGVTIEAELAAGRLPGDAPLLRQLIANLLQNAVAHNHAGGDVRVMTAHGSGATVLEVDNTGDVLDPAVVATLTEPFVRGRGRTRSAGDRHVGSGLGLAIVASIARVHGADLTLTARDDGGLRVRLLFPDRPVEDVSKPYPHPLTEL